MHRDSEGTRLLSVTCLKPVDARGALQLDISSILPAARKLTIAWQRGYNEERPHSSLGYRNHNPRPPNHFAPGILRLKKVGPFEASLLRVAELGLGIN